jgi:hypothetical protein
MVQGERRSLMRRRWVTSWLRGRTIGVRVLTLDGQARIAGLAHPRRDRELVVAEVEAERMEI